MKRLSALVTFPVLLALVWGGLWLFGASQIKSRAQAFFADSQNSPTGVRCEDFEVSGFPFSLNITCTGLLLTQGDLRLELETLAARLHISQPTRIQLTATGPAKLSDSFSGSRRQLDWSDMRASLQTNGWAFNSLEFNARDVELTDALIGQSLVASAQGFSLEVLDDPAAYDPENALSEVSVTGELINANLPEFEVKQANIDLEGRIAALPDDLRTWTLGTISKNWFENQTGIEITSFEGRDLSSWFQINGRLSATAQLMPDGDFDLMTRNLIERVQPFIDPRALQVLFGMQSQDMSHYQSYSIRHGVVLAGNLPLLTLKPLL